MNLLMIVTDPANPSAQAQALAWLTTDHGLWLVEGQSQSKIVIPASLTHLRTRLISLLQPNHDRQ